MEQTEDAFSFLEPYPLLQHNFREAIRHKTSSPDASARAAGVFAELLATQIAELIGRPRATDPKEDFSVLIDRLELQERCISSAAARLLHTIRKRVRNPASHGDKIFQVHESTDAVGMIQKLSLLVEPLFLNQTAGSGKSNNQFEYQDARQSPPESESAADWSTPFADGYSASSSPPSSAAYEFEANTSSESGGVGFGIAILACVAFGIYLIWHSPLSPGNVNQQVVAGGVQANPSVMSGTIAPSQNTTAQSVPNVEIFSTPKDYVVSPPAGIAEVHERTGPGVNYPEYATILRGTSVSGSGRAYDSHGEPWIQIWGDWRYIKESLLAEESSQAPDAAAQAETGVTPSDANSSTAQFSHDAPTQLSPADGSVFNFFPRTIDLTWAPVTGASTYGVEVDCYLCCVPNAWCTDVGGQSQTFEDVTDTHVVETYVGAQPGRWRVWATFPDGSTTPKSRWFNFTFLK